MTRRLPHPLYIPGAPDHRTTASQTGNCRQALIVVMRGHLMITPAVVSHHRPGNNRGSATSHPRPEISPHGDVLFGYKHSLGSRVRDGSGGGIRIEAITRYYGSSRQSFSGLYLPLQPLISTRWLPTRTQHAPNSCPAFLSLPIPASCLSASLVLPVPPPSPSLSHPLPPTSHSHLPPGHTLLNIT